MAIRLFEKDVVVVVDDQPGISMALSRRHNDVMVRFENGRIGIYNALKIRWTPYTSIEAYKTRVLEFMDVQFTAAGSSDISPMVIYRAG